MKKNKQGIIITISIMFLTILVSFLFPKTKAEEKNVVIYDELGNIILTEENKIDGMPYINPEWEEYMKLSEEEKNKSEVIPTKYIVDFIPSKKISLFSLPEVLPTTFNLKDVDGKNYYGKQKNQSSLGLCWDFASVATMETNARITGLGELDFSENQIDYATSSKSYFEEGYTPYGGGTPGTGGNFSGDVTNSINRGIAPQLESVWGSYNTTISKQTLKKTFDLSNVDYYVSDYIQFPSLGSNATEEVKQEYIEMIKKHIMQYGAIYVSAPTPDSRANYTYDHEIKTGETLDSIAKQYNTTKEAIMSLNNLKDENLTIGETIKVKSICYDSSQKLITYHKYCGKGVDSTHAMAIVGWDDNYGPNNEGAWILKNSWGNSIPNPYLSFKHSNAYSGLFGIIKMEKRNYDNNYDTSDLRKAENKTVDGKYSKMVTYNKLSNYTEILNRIGIETSALSSPGSVTYEVYISTTGKEEDLELIDTITPDHGGLISVDIDNLELKSDQFSIMVRPLNGFSPREIYAYTKNASESTNIVEETRAENNYAYFNGQIDLYSFSKNIETGSKIEYNLYDQDDNKITTGITNNKGYVVNGNAKTNLSYDSSTFKPGIYKVESVIDGQVLSSFDLSIGTGFVLNDDSKYKVGEGYIENVIPTFKNPITNVNSVVRSEFLNNFKVFDSNIYKQDLSDEVTGINNLMRSGMLVRAKLSNVEYRISVKGEMDGNGEINTGDVMKLYRHVLGTTPIEEDYYLRAGKVNNDEVVDTGDVLRLHRFVLGQVKDL